MAEKLRDYFAAGCRLVWYVDPELREVRVFVSPDSSRLVTIDGTLEGGDVLPGFSVKLRDVFEDLPLDD
jgi:Uma2 family endonuclease